MIKKLASRIVYRNPWMTVREDEVEFPGGHQGIYGVVEKPDFALIVPMEAGAVHLVRQYRYPVQGAYWEFPQGSYHTQGDVKPVELARGELSEETGLVAGSLEQIGFLHEANGYSNQGFHIFLATDLTQGPRRLEVTEQGMEVRRVSLADFEQMVLAGEIRDAPTLSAYALLKIKNIIP